MGTGKIAQLFVYKKNNWKNLVAEEYDGSDGLFFYHIVGSLG